MGDPERTYDVYGVSGSFVGSYTFRDAAALWKGRARLKSGHIEIPSEQAKAVSECEDASRLTNDDGTYGVWTPEAFEGRFGIELSDDIANMDDVRELLDIGLDPMEPIPARDEIDRINAAKAALSESMPGHLRSNAAKAKPSAGLTTVAAWTVDGLYIGNYRKSDLDLVFHGDAVPIGGRWLVPARYADELVRDANHLVLENDDGTHGAWPAGADDQWKRISPDEETEQKPKEEAPEAHEEDPTKPKKPDARKRDRDPAERYLVWDSGRDWSVETAKPPKKRQAKAPAMTYPITSAAGEYVGSYTKQDRAFLFGTDLRHVGDQFAVDDDTPYLQELRHDRKVGATVIDVQNDDGTHGAWTQNAFRRRFGTTMKAVGRKERTTYAEVRAALGLVPGAPMPKPKGPGYVTRRSKTPEPSAAAVRLIQRNGLAHCIRLAMKYMIAQGEWYELGEQQVSKLRDLSDDDAALCRAYRNEPGIARAINSALDVEIAERRAAKTRAEATPDGWARTHLSAADPALRAMASAISEGTAHTLVFEEEAYIAATRCDAELTYLPYAVTLVEMPGHDGAWGIAATEVGGRVEVHTIGAGDIEDEGRRLLAFVENECSSLLFDTGEVEFEWMPQDDDMPQYASERRDSTKEHRISASSRTGLHEGSPHVVSVRPPHTRRAHKRRQHYGKGNKQVKVITVRETFVHGSVTHGDGGPLTEAQRTHTVRIPKDQRLNF